MSYYFFLAFEVNLVGLLEKLSNGMKVKFNETGTNLRYDPGMLIGGNLVHECNIERGIGYYLEAVMILAPFCKNPVNIKFKGITETSLGNYLEKNFFTINFSIMFNFISGS